MDTHQKLRSRQRVFVEEYLVDLNASAAYQRAGYRVKSREVADAAAARLLADVRISKAVAVAMQNRSQRTEITQDQVLREWAVLGFADMKDYLKFQPSGSVVVDWSNLPEGATKAIAEVTVDEFIDGQGEDARPIRRIRFKLHDKQKALDSIAKHLGMLVERNVNLTLTPSVMDLLNHLREAQRLSLAPEGAVTNSLVAPPSRMEPNRNGATTSETTV